MTALAAALRTALCAAANPEDAAPMRAYMKTDQPFHGVKTPTRRRILSAALKVHPVASRREWQESILDLWQGEFREQRYLALDLAERIKIYRDGDAWPLFSELIHTADWWDTLDKAASNLAGPLVAEHPALMAEAVGWRDSDNLWLRRAALLVHLKRKQRTDRGLLSGTILHLADEEAFFIRKAIGWVLREFAKTDPDWVSAFVAAHRDRLSPLSRREALKHLGTALG